ncbi:MAG: hypothetical protein RM368_26855 [Nostoc sp. DedSLP03]|uniref:hypothetical protein n=1 Tax=Nostoc sp. DedSLP03 TaxID=3075400 RepID=UPI002AD58616|nr:hypothetical protein [Nostoc sp. DedSLP03]MDZ7968530.1 hypothetical protein [Nostoc sp. DedSLP03]
MTNDNNTNGLLKPSEKLRFQEIMSKILSQRLLLSNLSNAEQQDLFYLLNKLGIVVDLVEDIRSNPQIIKIEQISIRNSDTKNLLISRVIYITALIAIFLVFVTIPAMIATAITGSQFLGALIVVGLTLVLILGVGALMGKVSWGMFLLTTITSIITSVAFFVLLRILA